jgi:protein-disulfide isomerase
VRFVWKDFPLTSIHPQAFKASEAAHCAGDQGKYWQYHDRLFTNQQALQMDALKKHAADLGLDTAAFNACVDSGKYTDRVRKGLEEGTALGVGSTPSVFINGRLLMGAQPFEAFQAIIDDELQRTGSR